jgi:bifunctional N-acetylglucosamine-1-phosphate-uridyltransferase/glucosamine-1-phosphate-acetyltransferase GlmU-like protein
MEEYFITDLVEFMDHDGKNAGFIIADDEDEVMGVDDLSTLLRAQEKFKLLQTS